MEGALRGHRLGWVRVTRAVLESWRAMVSWTFEAPAVVSDGVTVTNVRIASGTAYLHCIADAPRV